MISYKRFFIYYVMLVNCERLIFGLIRWNLCQFSEKLTVEPPLAHKCFGRNISNIPHSILFNQNVSGRRVEPHIKSWNKVEKDDEFLEKWIEMKWNLNLFQVNIFIKYEEDIHFVFKVHLNGAVYWGYWLYSFRQFVIFEELMTRPCSFKTTLKIGYYSWYQIK